MNLSGADFAAAGGKTTGKRNVKDQELLRPSDGRESQLIRAI